MAVPRIRDVTWMSADNTPRERPSIRRLFKFILLTCSPLSRQLYAIRALARIQLARSVH